MIKEQDMRKCKICGVLKERILVGRYNNKDKKYVDLEGGSWNGRVCSGCHREKSKLNMQTLRATK